MTMVDDSGDEFEQFSDSVSINGVKRESCSHERQNERSLDEGCSLRRT